MDNEIHFKVSPARIQKSPDVVPVVVAMVTEWFCVYSDFKGVGAVSKVQKSYLNLTELKLHWCGALSTFSFFIRELFLLQPLDFSYCQ